MAKISPSEGSGKRPQTAASNQRNLSKEKVTAIQTSLTSFLQKEKKTYKDLDGALIQAFLTWDATEGKDALLQTLTQDIAKISIYKEDVGGNASPKLGIKTQQALIETSIGSVKRALIAANVDASILTAFDAIFTPDTFQDSELFETTLKKFIDTHAQALGDNRKKIADATKRLTMVDILRTMSTKKTITPEDITNLEQNGFAAASPELQDTLRDLFGKVIIPAEISLIAKDEVDKDLIGAHTFSRIPGLSSLVKEYDLSADALRAADPAYDAMMNNPSSTSQEKTHAALKAMAVVVEAKDKRLGGLIRSLEDNQFHLEKCSREQQQYYLDTIKQRWIDSKEGKKIAEIFGGLNATPEWKKNMMDQLFDLNKDTIELTNDKGQTMRIPLRKHITTNGWKGETLSEQVDFPLPLVFEIDGSVFAGDNQEMREKFLRLLGTHTQQDVFEWNGVRIVPGNTLRITDKLNPSLRSEYIYARKDAEGNMLLYKTPGSEAYLKIQKADLGNYIVEVEKPTYHIDGAAFPVVATLFTELKHSSDMKEKDAEAGIQEWNNDVTSESVQENFGGNEQQQEDEKRNERLRSVDWNNEESIKNVSNEDIAYAERTLAGDIEEMFKEQKTLENKIKGAKNDIKKLEKQIADLQQGGQVDLKKLNQLKKQLADKQLASAQLENGLQDVQEEIARSAPLYQKIAQENNKRKNTPLSPEARLAQQENEEKKESAKSSARKDFLEKWKGLSGDESLTRPEVGQVLLCQVSEMVSIFPGSSAVWMKAEIVGVDKDGIDIKWFGVEGKLVGAGGENLEGTKSRIHVETNNTESNSGMDDFIKAFGKVCKFPKETDVVSWGVKMKDPNTNWKMDKKYMDWIKMMQQKVDFSSMVKQGTDGDKKEHVKYFGSTSGEEKLWYEVEIGGKDITIVGKDRKGNRVKKTMEPNAFMMFAAEKGLHPYSQEEVDRANGGDQDSARKGAHRIMDDKDDMDWFMQPNSKKGTRWERNMISIASIAACWKDIKGSVNTYFEDKKKKDAARAKNRMLKSNWFNAAKKIPFGIGDALDDMGAGISNKLDNEKTKKINEYKEEVDKNKSTGGNGGTDYIIATLFDAPVQDPVRAAGYFLWALDNRGPYIRSLGKYEKDAMWVKTILGPKAVPDYRRYMERMKLEALTNPDAALAVEKGELGFMQYYFQVAPKEVKDDLIGMFGQKYFGGTLGAATYNLWYNKGKIQEDYKSEADKGTFSDVAMDSVYNDRTDDYFAYIVQDRVSNHIGALKAMSEKVGPSDENYKKWMSAMIYPYLAGKMETKMADPFKDEYRAIGKKTAFPFTQYVSDPRAKEKMTKLLDILSKDFVNSKGTSGKLSDNMKTGNAKEQAKSFFLWWTEHADELLKTLNDPGALLRLRETYRTEPGESDQKKMNTFTILNEFIEEKIQDNDASRFGDDFSGDSKIMESHIFNATTGLVTSQMTDVQAGNFKGAAAKNGQKLWEAMNTKIRSITREIETLKNQGNWQAAARLYAYTMKNFFRQFSGKFSGDEPKRKILIALRHYDLIKAEKDIDPLQLFMRGKYDERTNGEGLPDVMNQGLKLFETLFLKHKDLIDYSYNTMNRDILEVAIGKEMNARKVYEQSSPKELAETINSRKEYMKQLKMMQAMGGMAGSSLPFAPQLSSEEEDEDEEDDYYLGQTG